ncbi:MAG TPA: peptide ABC transporter substrate-binding protein [Opitutaceae bacterium]|nr:peptide ABC transporter substrate-binding protein [Opitutaceae bacterium]
MCRPIRGRDARATRTVRWWKRLSFPLALALFFSGCAKPASDTTHVLRISQRNEPADLDPATASLPDEFFVIRALGEGLLVPNPGGGAPLPAAAERYDISADGLAYTFRLRADAMWSNGEPVTAGDFVASYRRVLDPATAAPKAHLFFAVKNAHAFATGALTDFSAVGFRAADARTLVVTLERADPRFPLYVATGAWIPVNPRVVTQHGRAWTQPEHFVGNGAFTLAEWRPQQRIVVKKNPRYRDAARVQLDAIQFVRLDDQDAEERAFRSGQIDITMSVPLTKLEPYAHEHPAELHRAPLAETRFLSFNVRRAPLADPRVREALALSIDRALIVERVLRGGQEPAARFLSPPLAAGLNPPVVQHRLDVELARRRLAEAGFAGGKNFPRLELTAWSPSQTPVLEAIQQMWRRELGIEVALAIREAKVHLAALASGDYDIAFATTLLDVADATAALDDFTSDASNNFPHWRSPDFDRTVGDALNARDPAAIVQAENLLLAAAPVSPVYFNAHNWLMSPRVHGWREDALWTRYYQDIHLDEN